MSEVQTSSGDRFVVLKLMGFLLVVCGFFTGVGFYFPQKTNAPPAPPDYKKMKNMDELVRYGKDLAFSPGMGCTSCHGVGDPSKTRCPDWDGVGQRAGSRKPGLSATDYLFESVSKPSAFVVEGFGDIMKVPPMPDQRDVYAMVSYLQSLGGKPDETLLEKVKSMPAPARKKEKPIWALTPEEHGEKIVKEYGGCINCHAIDNDDPANKATYDPNFPKTGPSLSKIAQRQHKEDGKLVDNDAKYLFESIREPDKVLAKGCNGAEDGPCFGGVMPKTFADPAEAVYMSETYVADIAAYLWSLSGKKLDPKKAKLSFENPDLGQPKPKTLANSVKVRWTPEAVVMLNNNVPFARPMIQSSVERFARRQGLSRVTPALYEEARAHRRPPFASMLGTGKTQGKTQGGEAR